MIETKKLIKSFINGPITTKVLQGINFTVKNGEFVSIIGPSGSGKSTFLYQIGLLDHPTAGAIFIDGKNTETMSSKQRTKMRLDNFGFVFQSYALLPELTAIENVMLPSLMQGFSTQNATKQSLEILHKVGLTDHAYKLPNQMSGGQQQRVSIARAAAQSPRILFADEPTANLDSSFSQDVLDVFDLLHSQGQTIIMVTHEKNYAKRAERIVTLVDGKIVSDEKV